MGRKSQDGIFLNDAAITCGLTKGMLESGIQYVHDTLDTLDKQLLQSRLPRMAGLVELANLSSMIGNIFASGVVAASNGVFNRAGPHKYQDLRASGKDPRAVNIEVKVALEKNNPKGHLAKEGHYLVCRYVLGDVDGRFTMREWKASLSKLDKNGNVEEDKDVLIKAPSAKNAEELLLRQNPDWVVDSTPTRSGEIVWIWEVRLGYLSEAHFNLSNTAGDSGKSAVINAAGMSALTLIYIDKIRSPYGERSKYMKALRETSASPLP